MPLIHFVTQDMFKFDSHIDYMVNPCNLKGVGGKGLSLEFRTRAPQAFEEYVAACKSEQLHMGSVLVSEDTGHRWGIIHAPTKRHWLDSSDNHDIARTLEALRNLLKSERFRYATVGMPMLGTGLGKASYDDVYPMMVDHLSDLDATIVLSMAPDKTDMKPRYLSIMGPVDNRIDQIGEKVILETIIKIMDRWKIGFRDYTGIMSTGYVGLDALIGGEHFNVDYQDSFVYRHTAKKPIVVKPNTARNGVGAGMITDNFVCDLSNDVILFKPPGFDNNRLSAMQQWLHNDKERRASLELPPRRVAVFGEHDMTFKNNNLMVSTKD